MKKKTKIYLFMMAAVTAAVFVCRKTKEKQHMAREKGRHVPYGPYEAVIKRPLDVTITAMALVPLLPVMGITALFVRTKLGSPVLFKQERPGKEEKIFILYKFRTMTDQRDENGELMPDEKRLTKFGKWLRSTSLDELPELFNILKGDMSLVGPRPLLVEYLPYYTEREKMRHDVRPGLTGYAQVSGRNTLGWDERFEHDVQYAEKITFLEDIKIILMTVEKILSRSDVLDDFITEGNFAEQRKEKQNGEREVDGFNAG